MNINLKGDFMENYYNCIYMYINRINGKRYIGQAQNFKRRHAYHLSTSKKLAIDHAMIKYGIENFDIEILAQDVPTQEMLDELETLYIEKYDTLAKNGKGYNISSGGKGGDKFAGKTDEERKEIGKKISKALKGKYVGEASHRYGTTISEEQKEAIRQGNLGKNMSEETRRKISEGLTGKPKTKEHIEKAVRTRRERGVYNSENNPMYGRKHSEESKKKMSEWQRGEKSPRARKVVCVNTNYLFSCLVYANEWAIKADVGKCCRGKAKSSGKHPKTGESLQWMYLDEWLQIEGNSEEQLILVK